MKKTAILVFTGICVCFVLIFLAIAGNTITNGLDGTVSSDSRDKACEIFDVCP